MLALPGWYPQSEVSCAMLCAPVFSSSAVARAGCTHLQEELLLQLQGPALVQLRQGCQVPDVSTLEGDLQAAAQTCVSGIKTDLACITSRALAGQPWQPHLLLPRTCSYIRFQFSWTEHA